MQKVAIHLNEIKLVGLKTRTSYQNEINPATAKIGSYINQYFSEQISTKISSIKNPGVHYCVYTEYESDYKGAYTYFIGQEVTSLDQVDKDLAFLVIPPQSYIKFTTDAGPIPQVIIKAWQEIWQMSPQDLGGKRAYKADFEVYDERASNLQQAVVDVYIGINKE